MNDFISWATIVGGFSGLLSFIYLIYEKITSGPKVISEIAFATVYEREPSQSDQWYNYDFIIELEIGNVGTKLTSVLKPKLDILEISKKYELFFPDDANYSLPLSHKPSVPLEPGYANSYTLRCNHRSEKKLEVTAFSGRLELKQIKGKNTRHDFKFEKWLKHK